MKQIKLDTYLDLCTQYYDISKPKPPDDAYAFYKSYIANTKGSILEPMCGTGRYLLPLLEDGYNVVGFDASDHMLKALHEKAKHRNLNPQVWQGFVEDLKKSERYELIFIPTGSFGLITALAAAKTALKTFYDHLTNGGILLFEVETLKAMPSESGIWRGRVLPREDGKYIIGSFLTLPLEEHICSTICKYELVDGNTIINSEIESFKVRLYEPDTFIPMLQEAGFKDIRMIKAFDNSQVPDQNDDVIIYECRKLDCPL